MFGRVRKFGKDQRISKVETGPSRRLIMPLLENPHKHRPAAHTLQCFW